MSDRTCTSCGEQWKSRVAAKWAIDCPKCGCNGFHERRAVEGAGKPSEWDFDIPRDNRFQAGSEAAVAPTSARESAIYKQGYKDGLAQGQFDAKMDAAAVTQSIREQLKPEQRRTEVCNSLIQKIMAIVKEAYPDQRLSDFDVLDQGVRELAAVAQSLRAELEQTKLELADRERIIKKITDEAVYYAARIVGNEKYQQALEGVCDDLVARLKQEKP